MPTVTPKTPQQVSGDPGNGTHTVPSTQTRKDGGGPGESAHQPGPGELPEARAVPGDTSIHPSGDKQPRSPVKGEPVTAPPSLEHRPGDAKPGSPKPEAATAGAAKPVVPKGDNKPATDPKPTADPKSPVAQDLQARNGTTPGTGVPGLPAEGTEVTGARTDATSVYQNPDGTKTLRVYPRPVHYQKADGSWDDINTNFALDRAGRWTEQANSQQATFATKADDPALVSWSLDAGHVVSYGLQDAAAVRGVVQGDTLTYPLARPASDVVYNGLAQGIKESLVLHDATAPTSWVFPLHVTGLTPALGPGGEVQFKDASGVVKVTIPHGFMTDSHIDPASGDGVVSDRVTYRLIDVNGAPALRMDLDEAWLHDAKRVFPVTVDPSTTSIGVGQSTYVRSGQTANFSTDPLLRVGTYDGGASKVNSYLYFPGVVSALKGNYLHAVSLNLNNTHSYECKPHPVYVNQITSPWDPSTINTYPGVSIGQQLGTASFSAGDACGGAMWESIDLGGSHTDPGVQLVESWAREGDNFGLALTASTTDSNHWKKFSSANSAYPPYLSIAYSDWAATYAPANSYMPPTYNTPGSQQVTLTNVAANWWNWQSMQVKARLFDSNWNEQWFNAPMTGVPGLVKTYDSVTVDGVIPPLPLGRSYILCWDGYVHGTTSLHDSYSIPFGNCTWVSGANTAPQLDLLAPMNNTVVGSLTPQIYATGHDPDNYPGAGLDYDFRVYTNPSSGDPQLVAESGWQPSTSWAVPPGKLAWHSSYLWNVKVSDHGGESPFSGTASFSTQVQQPVITSHLGGAVGDGAGRPFDAKVGNYTTSATDADIKSIGPVLSVNRSYNSLDPRTSTLFGTGWTSNFDMKVQPDNDGTDTVVLTTASGRSARFGADPSKGAVYTPPPGEFQSLSKVSAGFDLMAKDGTRYEFHAASGTGYALSTVRDAVGRTQELSYTDGRLVTVKDTSSGRALHFGWTADNRHVARVSTDPVIEAAWNTTLAWTYTYNPANPDELDQVCAPTTGGNTARSCTTYSYIPGSHLRSAVLDSAPVSYWRLGESSGGTAASEVAENQGNDNARYSGTGVTLGTPGPAASATAATFDGSSGYVGLPQSVLDTSTYTSVGLWFKTNSWGVLFSYQADPFPGSGSTPANYTPALYVGQSGKLHGKFWNGPSNTIDSSAAVNDGKWHFALLAAAGSTQTLYLDGQPQGTPLPGAVIAPGQRSEAVGGGFLSANWPDNPYGSSGQANYFNGSISDVAFYNRTLGAPAVTALWQAGSQPSAELTGLTLPSGKTGLAVSYDTAKDRASKVTDENGGTWTLNAPTVAGSSQEYQGTVMGSRPAGYWRLSDGAGVQAANQVFTPRPTPNNGSYANVALGAPGPMTGSAGAATFDGSTSWAELPAAYAPQNGPGALGLWFRTDSAGVLLSYQSFLISGRSNGSTDRWNPALYVGNDGKLHAQLWMGDAAQTMATGTPVNDGKWHFAVLSADSQTSQTLYLDGARAAGPLNGTITPNGTNHVFLGAGTVFGGWPQAPADSAGHFKGQLADVAAYPHGLSAPTVASLYQLATTSGATQYDAGVVDAHPTGYWRLGDSTGNQVTDLISSAALAQNRGTYHDAVCCQTGPWASGSATATGFNGTSSYVKLPDNTAPKHWGAATVELWFKTTAPGVLYSYQSFPVDGRPNGSTDRWNPALYIGTDKKLYGTLWTGSANNALVSASTVADGAWHHVALAGDGSGQTLYLDGAPTATSTTALPITYNGSAYAYLGAGWTGGGWPNAPTGPVGHLNGTIADFSIYQYRLTGDTVSGQYRLATAAAPVGGLDAAAAYRASVVQDNAVGYWRLNDPSGSGYAATQLGDARPDVTSGNLTDVDLNAAGPSGDPNQRAAVFNGATSQIQLPSDAAPIRGAASIELWFKTTSGGPLYSYQDFPVGSPPANVYNPALYVGSDGRIHGEFWMGPGAAMTSDRTVNDGNWHQVVLTGDDRGQTIYLDGRASASDSTGRKITFNGTPYVYLGAGTTTSWPAAGGDHFKGTIAEASYYASRLDADTVTAHYKSMGGGDTPTAVTTATVTDPTGYKLAYRYDTRTSQLISRSDGYGNTTRYSYDTAGYLYAVTDPNGHTITTGHDARGNTVSRTTCRSAGSCQTSYATYYLDTGNPFNPANDKILTSSDARSTGPTDTTYTTRYSYDAAGQLASTTTAGTRDFPKGRVSYTLRTDATSQAQDGGPVPAGLIRMQTGLLDAAAYPDPAKVPADQQTSYSYRSNGDLATVAAPLRPAVSYGYDNLGRTTSQSFGCDDCPGGSAVVPRILRTDYTWDGQGHQVTRTDPYTTDAVTGAKHTRQTTIAYDVDGNQTGQTVADTAGGDPARTTTWTYESDTSRVKQVKDSGGHVTSYTYDRYGNVATHTDAAGTTYSYSHSPMGQLQQTAVSNYTGSSATPTAPRWQVIGSRSYDPAGRPATDTDAMGRATHTYYNDDNTVAEIDLDGYHNTDGTLRNVVLQQNTYDDAGHLAQQVTGGGKTTTATAYDAAGRVTSTSVDPGGLNRTTSYTYDVADRPTSVVSTGGADASSAQTDYAYDVTGNLLKQTARNQPADAVVAYGYNSRGLRTSTISPNGNAAGADPVAYTSTTGYDEAGRPTITTGPLFSAEAYDPASRSSKPQQTRPIGRSGYDTFGQLTSQVDPVGNTATYTYDLDGNRVAVASAAYTDPQSGIAITPTSTVDYDVLGRPVKSVIDPTGLKLTSTMRYDQFGNLVQATLPPTGGTTAPTVTNSYDLDGELLATTGPTGAVSQSTYDDLGRRITSTQLERYPAPAAYTSTFTWDDAGNQLSSTPPGGGVSKATYNAVGQVLSATGPTGVTVRSAYDGLGRTSRATGADGTATVTGYDRLGRTLSTTDLDTTGATVATQYATYDLEGNILSATDKVANSADIAAHARQFSYNPAGLAVQQVEPAGAGQTITTSFGYDTGGRKTRWTNGKNIPVYYTYNSLGLPESTVEPPTTAHPTAAEGLFTTSYDAAGRVATLTEPGGVVRRRSYDGAGNLTQETATGAEVATPNRTLGYDAAGRLISVGTPGTTPDTYTYNDRGQLLTSAGPGGAGSYSYNGDSRMTARTDAAGTTSYGYNAAGQVTSATDPLTGATVGYDYDTAGRLTTERYGTGGGTRTYGYDNLGRLRDDTIKNPSATAVARLR
ncbi:LamG-like jellyroll fold domain-containing protein, partial [Streptomyces sp. CB01881]|uniref:LamG-like jellyroll fold domain-containing protein n=1 Tax=Streptomyces sp. CB01881 TaxID=2078691 RepID=UPI0018841535